MNFSEFCIGSFSSVPMNFWVFLSIPSTGGRDLAPYCKKWKNNFFFSRSKILVKIAFFAFWVKIFHHFFVDAAEILSFWGEMGAYSTRKWRKNRKICWYRRERDEGKFWFFKIFDFLEKIFFGGRGPKRRGTTSRELLERRGRRWGWYAAAAAAAAAAQL